MKKLLIILLVILAVLVGALTIVGKGSSATLYDDAPHVNYANITDDVLGQNLYYFYQDTCVHCNNIKADMAKFYYNKPEDIDFYLVDGADKANSDVWFRGEQEDFIQPSGKVESADDIKILGTPTLIEITDGVITQFLVGEEAIPSYLGKL